MSTLSSSNTITATAFARAADSLLGLLTEEQLAEIAGSQADEGLQKRIEELAEKANEGELSNDERAEYEGYIRANRFIAIFQAQARRKQSSAATG